MNNLKQYLISTSPSDFSKSSELEGILADSWGEFEGSDDQNTNASKLNGRMEKVRWNNPVLRFVIERHGGTVNGSSRAELHHWELNLDDLTARIVKTGHRQLTPMAPRVNVKPIAMKIANEILAMESNDYLKWKSGNRVHVIFSRIFDSGTTRTDEGRRRRCRENLEIILKDHDWKHINGNVFEKQVGRECS